MQRMDSKQARFQVLALSGGGYRGLYTAKILADLEEDIGGPIARRFDLIDRRHVHWRNFGFGDCYGDSRRADGQTL